LRDSLVIMVIMVIESNLTMLNLTNTPSHCESRKGEAISSIEAEESVSWRL
jgi:hypothetical protein